MIRVLLLVIVALPFALSATASPFSISLSADYYLPHRDIPFSWDYRIPGSVYRLSTSLTVGFELSDRISIEAGYRVVPKITKHVYLALSEGILSLDPSKIQTYISNYNVDYCQDAFPVALTYRIPLQDGLSLSFGPVVAVERVHWRLTNLPLAGLAPNEHQDNFDSFSTLTGTTVRAGGCARVSCRVGRRVDLFAQYLFLDSHDVPASFLGGGLAYRF